MDLLTVNDKAGKYPPSWYAASADAPALCPQLRGDLQADVCVIGGGYTGLSAALHMAQKGLDVVLIEAHRVGFGASGRNGGHVGTGFNTEQPTLEKMMGKADARRMWDIAEEAKSLTADLIATHAPEAGFHPGIAHAQWQPRGVQGYHDSARWLAENYGYDKIECLDTEAMRAVIGTDKYHGGVIDWGSAHIHPLRHAFGLARAAKAAGVRIFEGTRALRVENGTKAVVHCSGGKVTASHVVMACNGYLGDLSPQVAAKVMPINTYMVATAPLGFLAKSVLTKNIAVDDSKFVVTYFHLSDDGRLILGGAESYGYRYPADIKSKVRARIIDLFPQLTDVPITHAWGGTLAITLSRLPHLTRPAPNVWSASGYSGYGVALSSMSGKLIAEAIAGETERFDLMASIPATRFPGGPRMRHPLLVLAMSWFALRDRLGI